MADQDAQDINQMMSASADGVVKQPKKSKFLWVVLGCVVVGVGLGIFVYQQSLKPAPKPSTAPRPTAVATPTPTPIPSAITPGVSEISPVSNTITFPKSGKLRIYHNVNNVQVVIQLVINGTTKTITMPAKPVSTTALMNFADATFDVTAGSSGAISAFLNSTSGPKLRGWIPPQDSNNMKECGVPGAEVANFESEKAYVVNLLSGETLFQYQCWEDDDVPGEFNDVYMVWTYVPGSATTTSPSPSGSTTASASPSSSSTKSPSPSPSRAASPSPSSAATTATPTPSPRVTMPDTSEGTPVTGIFEVTVGTISVGLVLLLLGLFGLLVL